MKKMIIFCTLVCLVVLPTFSFAYSMADYQYQETRELVSFVVSAAEEIEKVGEEAFPQFREKGGKWFRNDSYVIIWGLDGMRYVYPPDLSGEGKNMLGLEDINGKPIGRMIVEIGTTSIGEGWLHYQWPRPGETEPSKKLAYEKKMVIDDFTLIVGASYYPEQNS